MPSSLYRKRQAFVWNRISSKTSRCPYCRTHFSRRKVKKIWKDFVECTACGHMWILKCNEIFEKFYQPKYAENFEEEEKDLENIFNER